jgi:hypothetical protein
MGTETSITDLENEDERIAAVEAVALMAGSL